MMASFSWNLDEPGKRCVLSGNEAAARGALEGGAQVVTSYPGSPSVQILECLAAVGHERKIYAQWSINEKVALEVAAAASFSGLRSLSVMKADGLNVALDFLTTLPLSGINAGLVLIVSDDPGAHSSVKEEDTRYLAPPAHVPLLEPANPEESRDMVTWAFEISEKAGLPFMVRMVTRICHARGNVSLGALKITRQQPHFPVQARFVTAGRFHPRSHERLEGLQQDFERSAFNHYMGPEKPALTIFTSGVSYWYAVEAVESLGVENSVGIFKIGTLWPVPEKTVLDVLKRSRRVLFFEEIEPFLEEQTMILAAQYWVDVGPLAFLGKRSGDVPWIMKTRGMGEMDPDITTQALAKALGIDFQPRPASLKEKLEGLPELELPLRLPILCAGCPHRASYWAIKTALAMDGRDGFALGDIGCYALGVLPTGYQTIRTLHSMGSGAGLASGFGKLQEMGLNQPIVAVIGDSTFYHAGIPALINARVSGARYLCIILDNGTTAMTGHQPHPGSGITAMGDPVLTLPIPEIVRGLGIPLTIRDPYEIHETTNTILDLLRKKELHVLLLQRECALTAGRGKAKPHVYVNPEICLGDACGCSRFCTRVFSCPANIFDEEAGKAKIDETLCTGCGVCAALCPQGAIIIEEERAENDNRS